MTDCKADEGGALMELEPDRVPEHLRRYFVEEVVPSGRGRNDHPT